MDGNCGSNGCKNGDRCKCYDIICNLEYYFIEFINNFVNDGCFIMMLNIGKCGIKENWEN